MRIVSERPFNNFLLLQRQKIDKHEKKKLVFVV